MNKPPDTTCTKAFPPLISGRDKKIADLRLEIVTLQAKLDRLESDHTALQACTLCLECARKKSWLGLLW
jgi:hypothetical protein